MATRTGLSSGPSGLTITAKLGLPGVDTVSLSVACTELSNMVGWYVFSIADLATAVYAANFCDADGNVIWQGWIRHVNTTSVTVEVVGNTVADVATGAVTAEADIAADDLADIADAVWAATARTLTQTAAEVAAVMAGTTLTIQRGDTLTVSLTGLGNISTRTKLWFCVKEKADDDDDEAQLFAEETAGLQYVAGAAPTASQTATITVTNATTGAVTIVVSAAATAALTLTNKGVWDVQMKTASSVTTLTQGTAKVVKDVTRATG